MKPIKTITKQTKKVLDQLSRKLLKRGFSRLTKDEQEVIESIASGETIVDNVNDTFDEQLTFGQKFADRIARFGGSWAFIIIFLFILFGWMAINVFFFTKDTAFDPYPFILLNLVLSSLAAFQAPIIMMSQNRQAAKDRIEIEKNYQISLKTDLEIARLHQKIDALSGNFTSQGSSDKLD